MMLPWPAMLRAALSAGVAPEAFWRLSLREWRWLAGEAGDAMSRVRLAALMGAYPDREVRAVSSFDFAQDESVAVPHVRSAHAERSRSTSAGGIFQSEENKDEQFRE